MSPLHLGAALALLTAVPLAVAAQDPDPDPQPDVRIHVSRGPRLGLMLERRADAEADKLGARVRRVLPDSPAERAGLRAGDIVTRFNDTRLGGLAGDDGDSGPGAKLSELALRLQPGDTVRLEYRRGNDTRTATVVASDLDEGFAFEMPRFDRIMPRLEGLAGRFNFGPAWHGLEMVDLNPALGEYFGAKEGTLVVDTHGDSLPIHPGDVILKIDGRTPQNAAHAERILGSYAGGEQVKLEIMRKQRKETVSWTVPERKEAPHGPHGRRMRMFTPG